MPERFFPEDPKLLLTEIFRLIEKNEELEKAQVALMDFKNSKFIREALTSFCKFKINFNRPKNKENVSLEKIDGKIFKLIKLLKHQNLHAFANLLEEPFNKINVSRANFYFKKKNYSQALYYYKSIPENALGAAAEKKKQKSAKKVTAACSTRQKHSLFSADEVNEAIDDITTPNNSPVAKASNLNHR
ncbi:MAG: hypothetical protein QNK11_08875 [Legionella sp.]|nr:hypothetical protein [Legionella sp.]